MKKAIMLFWGIVFSTISVAQTPIPVETIIDSVDWNEVTEPDIVYMFKNNICKQDEPNREIGGYYTSYYIKNVSVGKYIAHKSDVLVDEVYRKIKRINIVFPEDSPLWNNPNDIERTIVDVIIKILGDKYTKTEVNLGNGIQDVTYSWNDQFINPCKLTLWFIMKAKTCAILVGNDVKI